jgi:hypothetical protein
MAVTPQAAGRGPRPLPVPTNAVLAAPPLTPKRQAPELPATRGHELHDGLHVHLYRVSAEDIPAIPAGGRTPELPDHPRPDDSPKLKRQCCDTWKQVTSYWDTECGLFEF